jgi:hypothetical protein
MMLAMRIVPGGYFARYSSRNFSCVAFAKVPMLCPGAVSGAGFSIVNELMLVVITPSVPMKRKPNRSSGTPLFRFTRRENVKSPWVACLP